MDIRFGEKGFVIDKAIITIKNKFLKDGEVMFNAFGCSKMGKVINIGYNIGGYKDIKTDTLYEANISYNQNNQQYEISILKEAQPIDKQPDFETHPSWGVASISNTQSGRNKLFGSMAYYGNHFTLRIHQARVLNNNSFSTKDGIMEHKELIEIAMTREQLLGLIAGVNSGAGSVPCTIEYNNGEYIKYQPEKTGFLENELKKILAEWTDNNKTIKQCQEKLQQLSIEKPTKEVKDKINKTLETLVGFTHGTMVYNIEQLVEKIEKLAAIKGVNEDQPMPLPATSMVNKKIEFIKELRNKFDILLCEAKELGEEVNWDMVAANYILKKLNKEKKEKGK